MSTPPTINTHTGTVYNPSSSTVLPFTASSHQIGVPLSVSLSEYFLHLDPHQGATGSLDDLHTLAVPSFDLRELDLIPDLSTNTSIRFSRSALSGKVIGLKSFDSGDNSATSTSSLTRKSLPLHLRSKGSTSCLPFDPAAKTTKQHDELHYPKELSSVDDLLSFTPSITSIPGLPDFSFHSIQPFTLPKTSDKVIVASSARESLYVEPDQLQAALDALNQRYITDIDEYEDDFDFQRDDVIKGTEKPSSLRYTAAKASEALRSLEKGLEPDPLVETMVGRIEKEKEVTGGSGGFTRVGDPEFDGLFEDELNLAIKYDKSVSKGEWSVLDTVDVSDFHQKIPFPAINFPFELDPFQKRSILRLEQGHNVFTAAHTSAGKTVVADYAIALSRKFGAKAIYTSPIKTLSNQKFRDFKEKFGDVGIMTGDVTLNEKASCLIMTTEILRNLLYRGADVIRDVLFVIFDECHYLNDKERGVVWEECLILLPKTVQTVLLSATVPNIKEFSDWVGRTQKKIVYISTTDYRPVPLEYFLTNGLANPVKILDQRGNIDRSALKKMRENFENSKAAAKGRLNPQWSPLVQFLKKKDLLPCLIFCFSKKGCEYVANELYNLDFSAQSSKIKLFINNSLAKRLSPEDRQLPQIQRVSTLLSRGVGIHHSGLLPILKEIVEMLFQRGLINVLVCTETFALGVNAPTRSVVLSGLRKHDGRDFRYLLSSEFTQISGRAGRRGLDTSGSVFVALWGNDEFPDEYSLTQVLRGTSTRLASQFRINYLMLLNLYRTKALGVEEMLRLSFSEHHLSKLMPGYKNLLLTLQNQLSSLPQIICPFSCQDTLEEYWECNTNIAQIDSSILFLANHEKCVNTGRIVLIRNHQHFDLAVVLKRISNSNDLRVAIFNISDSSVPYIKYELPTRKQIEETIPVAVFIPCSFVVKLARDEVKLNAAYLDKDPLQNRFALQIRDGLANKVESLTFMDGRALGIGSSLEFTELFEQRVTNLSRAEALPAHSCPRYFEHYPTISKKQHIVHTTQELSDRLSDAALTLVPDLRIRTSVLQHLGYIDADKSVLLKGRVACELSTVEDLTLTELIFENVLQPLTPAEAASLLSVFVAPRSRDLPPMTLTPALAASKDTLIQTAVSVCLVEKNLGLDVVPSEVVKSTLSFSMMQVVFDWASGKSFAEIIQTTDLPEGSIVRSILRLDETCRDVKNAAFVIGDRVLSKQMEDASKALRRDIVFAASLYLT
ncbi:hypothetical protein RCL1_004062 [Eukaryota sp. TZLM3-RCL]